MRVVVADDEVLLREGLARLLTETGFEVVGKAGDPDQLLNIVRHTHPEVAIVDIKMPPTHTDEGLVAAEEIRRHDPTVGVLVLSHYLDSRYAMRLLATIVPSPRWGVATVAPAGWNPYFKGGWGSGTGLVDHQAALLTLGKTRVSLAITTRFNPTHAYGKETLRGVAARLLRGL